MKQQVKLDAIAGKTVESVVYDRGDTFVFFTDDTFAFVRPECDHDDDHAACISEVVRLFDGTATGCRAVRLGIATVPEAEAEQARQREHLQAARAAAEREREAKEKAEYERLKAKFGQTPAN